MKPIGRPFTRRRGAAAPAALALALALAACGDSSTVGEPESTPAGGAQSSGDGGGEGGGGEARFPAIVDVEATRTEPGIYDFAVTISSPYDSPERYADGWRVLSPEGEVLGEHQLAHDHADEQPFTRTQSGVEIPDGIERVEIEPHDLRNGYGGERADVALP